MAAQHGRGSAGRPAAMEPEDGVSTATELVSRYKFSSSVNVYWPIVDRMNLVLQAIALIWFQLL